MLGLAARTTVAAGTANAVSGSMNKRSHAQAQQAAEAQAFRQQQAATPAPYGPAATMPAPGGDGTIEALERLASLRSQGILTDGEFAAQKARILGG